MRAYYKVESEKNDASRRDSTHLCSLSPLLLLLLLLVCLSVLKLLSEKKKFSLSCFFVCHLSVFLSLFFFSQTDERFYFNNCFFHHDHRYYFHSSEESSSIFVVSFCSWARHIYKEISHQHSLFLIIIIIIIIIIITRCC